ncbi:MAG: formylglycine-generating enzyme family protein, partial [Alphaproteobacteria bacterium]
MVWVPGGEFEMGALDGDTHARPDEKPRHRVRIDGFFMDATEVTNRQFAKFVAATGFKTTAERRVEWEQIRKDLP